MKFPYVYRGYGYMPVIPVTVINGDHCLVTEALVDSGAARSIFDVQIGEAIGITDIESGDVVLFEGVSGHKLAGFCHEITLVVGGNHSRT